MTKHEDQKDMMVWYGDEFEWIPPPEAQKQADRATPPGRPLEPWGDKEVEITPEDVARAIVEFNERVPEAAGLLNPREG